MGERVPLGVALLLGLVPVLTGAVVCAVTRRAADGRLARNEFGGIRTRATTRSDAAWREGHRAARGLSDAAAVVFALTGVGAVLVRDAAAFATVVLVGMLSATVVLLVGVRRAVRAADAAE